jgi:hypothetical protein
MIKNLVLSGGGQRGLCYVGIIKYLEEIGIINNIFNIMGVSVGSIFALMINLNINYKQLSVLLSIFKTDIGELNINDIFSFFDTFGIESGKQLEKFIKACIKVKLGNEDATFTDLYNFNNNKRLLIVATELSYRQREIFSYEHTPNLELWKAIRISCSYPLYYQPIRIDDKIYVDGGVCCNYPIDYFKNDLDNTIGIVFKDINPNYKFTINNITDYMTSIFSIVTTSTEEQLIELYKDNTISIDTNVDEILDYKMSKELKEKYFEIGYNEFKTKWNEKFTEFSITNNNNTDNPNWKNELDDIKSELI